MRELNKQDLSWAVRLLPLPVKDMMEKYGPRLVLGGGYLRSTVSGEKPNDLDLFTRSPEESKIFADELGSVPGRKRYDTENAYSVRLPGQGFVQFIHRWTFQSPHTLLDSFDFTIACAAIWVNKSGKWTSLIDDSFYEDLAAKRLVYRSPIRNEDAGGSLLRLLKFQAKGFRSPLNSIAAVIARTLKDWPDDIGTYAEYDMALEITKRLVLVDPQVDPTHEAHLPSTEETDADIQS